MAFDGVSDAEAAWNAVAGAHAMSDDPLSCLGVLREMGTCAENPIEPSQAHATTSGKYGANPCDAGLGGAAADDQSHA